MNDSSPPIDFGRTRTGFRRKIAQAKSLLESIEPRPGHILLDLTVARYLHDAVAVADSIRAICEEKRYRGAQPLIRYLFETALNLEYLLGHEDPDVAAAQTFIADMENLSEQERRAARSQVVMGPPEADEVVVWWDDWVRGSFDGIKEHLVENLGEDPDEVERIFTQASENMTDHWHWAGTGPGGLVEGLAERMEDARIGEVFRAHRRHLWKLTSNQAHPSPHWEKPHLVHTHDGKTLEIEDPLGEHEDMAAAHMGMAMSVLNSAVIEVRMYYDPERPRRPDGE